MEVKLAAGHAAGEGGDSKAVAMQLEQALVELCMWLEQLRHQPSYGGMMLIGILNSLY